MLNKVKIINFLKIIFLDNIEIKDKKLNFIKKVFNIAIIFLIIFFIFNYSFSNLKFSFNWENIYKYRNKFIIGFANTIIISFSSLILSILIGFFSAIAQISNITMIKYISKGYVTIIRGTPLLVQILVFFYIIADAFGIQNRYVAGVIILSMFSGAYITEIIRGGIISISNSQKETMKALGFTEYQKYRYIIIPQIFKIILPALIGQLASLIKDSSLLSIISISEFTLNAQEINAFTFSTFEAYIPLAIGYFILTYIINIFGKFIEKKYSFEH
ncbi:MAG: ABC transporter permease subunit [Spirochaetes bacterium]|nr:ABC transporter permease subunit [Spirochaetota bacterium]